MPFDGVGVRNNSKHYKLERYQTIGLAEVISRMGISSIDLDILNQHKAEQVALHPASFAYRHATKITIGINLITITLALSALLMFVALPGRLALIGPAMFIVGCLTLLFASEQVVMRKQAAWIETGMELYAYLQVSQLRIPRPIASLLWDIRREIGFNPAIRLIYGELIQDTQVLDPYLILVDKNTGHRFILGIWDGDEVLHIAQ